MIEITIQPNGSKIKMLRIAKKWTQEDLAEKVGCSKRTVENAEAGKRLKESYLENIAEALGVPFADLVVSDNGKRDWQGHPSSIETSSEYTDGDWITAAIVGSDHAETKLKTLAGEFRKLKTSSQDGKLDQIVERVQSVIDALLEKHAKGGNTDETRLDACIAKVVADILQRELSNFQWNADERPNEDPAVVFRDMVKAFVESERNKWKR